ncbi:hypothetical protein [Pseudoalteromonas arctica]|nr:hypothetical protein [Pseudoalteromonas arctica]
MRELNVKEIQVVSGGPLPIAAALAVHLVGNALSIYGWYSLGKDLAKE